MAVPITDLESRILYEEEGRLIVNKPHDIPTSGRNLEDADAVQYWLMKRQNNRVWAVHQLDADTTGVNIFVTRKKLVGKYQKALSAVESVKRYLAVVHGEPSWEKIECVEPIGYVDERSLGVTPEGKNAESHFKVIDKNEGYSLIEAEIVTGRTHQIRIHLSHLGHPLVGEEWYCEPPCEIHPRQALHAWKVVLAEPMNETFCAPLAPDLVELCHQLRLDCGEYDDSLLDDE